MVNLLEGKERTRANISQDISDCRGQNLSTHWGIFFCNEQFIDFKELTDYMKGKYVSSKFLFLKDLKHDVLWLAQPGSSESSFYPFTPACHKYLRQQHGAFCSQPLSLGPWEKSPLCSTWIVLNSYWLGCVMWPILSQSLCLGRYSNMIGLPHNSPSFL